MPYLHSSAIIKAACPGDWIAKGDMAPEPAATLAVTTAMDETEEWVLDGYPRSERQIASVHRTPIIYLAVTRHQALRRAASRGRMPINIETHRITEQTKVLAPVLALSACVIQTGWRTADEVFWAAIQWLENDVQPREYP